MRKSLTNIFWNIEVWAVQKHVNYVDLFIAFKGVFTCKHRRRYSWERASQSLPKNAKKFDEKFLKYWGLSGAKACKSCRSRQELSNEYLLAKFGVDIEENALWSLIIWLRNQSKVRYRTFQLSCSRSASSASLAAARGAWSTDGRTQAPSAASWRGDLPT